jgi:hypothetical protein
MAHPPFGRPSESPGRESTCSARHQCAHRQWWDFSARENAEEYSDAGFKHIGAAAKLVAVRINAQAGVEAKDALSNEAKRLNVLPKQSRLRQIGSGEPADNAVETEMDLANRLLETVPTTTAGLAALLHHIQTTPGMRERVVADTSYA